MPARVTRLFLIFFSATSAAIGAAAPPEKTRCGCGLGAECVPIGASKQFLGGTWRQHLTILGVGETIYLDEGDGAVEKEC